MDSTVFYRLTGQLSGIELIVEVLPVPDQRRWHRIMFTFLYHCPRTLEVQQQMQRVVCRSWRVRRARRWGAGSRCDAAQLEIFPKFMGYKSRFGFLRTKENAIRFKNRKALVRQLFSFLRIIWQCRQWWQTLLAEILVLLLGWAHVTPKEAHRFLCSAAAVIFYFAKFAR